jgi:hypothetical protein
MIWPFTKKENKISGFQGLRLTDLDGTVYEYYPVKHITAREVALLLPLAMNESTITDKFAYIRQQNLTRHFIKVEE